jgi:hypothetical protein
MRRLTLFSTLLSVWIFGTCLSEGADAISAPTSSNADWMRQQAGLVKELVEANDLHGAIALVVNAVAAIEATSSAAEGLGVAKALFDHDDELLPLVPTVAGNYPAPTPSIARSAARGASHIAHAIAFAAGYSKPRLWDHIQSASIFFFNRHRFHGIPGVTSINPATWWPQLLNISKAKLAGVDVAWHHRSSNSLPVRVPCR